MVMVSRSAVSTSFAIQSRMIFSSPQRRPLAVHERASRAGGVSRWVEGASGARTPRELYAPVARGASNPGQRGGGGEVVGSGEET